MKVLTGRNMQEIVEKHHTEILKYLRIDYMIPAVPAENFYQQKRGEILKLFYEENSRVKFDRKSLEHAYTFKNGHRCYRFPKHMGLPLERFGKMKFYLMWMQSGISPHELRSLIEKASAALADGIVHPENASKIGLVLEEIKGRERLTIHTELLYNFLAVQWVRDDEDPVTYNNQIQLEKVEMFREEVEAGNSYFFFQQSELRMLSTLYRMSEEEWKEYWSESLNNQSYLKAMEMILAKPAKPSESKSPSGSASTDTQTTSKPAS